MIYFFTNNGVKMYLIRKIVVRNTSNVAQLRRQINKYVIYLLNDTKTSESS